MPCSVQLNRHGAPRRSLQVVLPWIASIDECRRCAFWSYNAARLSRRQDRQLRLLVCYRPLDAKIARIGPHDNKLTTRGQKNHNNGFPRRPSTPDTPRPADRNSQLVDSYRIHLRNARRMRVSRPAERDRRAIRSRRGSPCGYQFRGAFAPDFARLTDEFPHRRRFCRQHST